MTLYHVDPKEKDIKKSLRCPKHKQYRAIRKPAVNCRTCWKLYKLRHASDRT